ncbi:MAG: stage III sporulation protein AE [Bacillota bacterium]
MRFQLVVVLAIVLALVPLNAAGGSDPASSLIDERLDKIDFTEVERVLREAQEEAGEYLLPLGFADAVKQAVSGKSFFDTGALVLGLSRYVFGEVASNLGLLGQLIFLAVIAALLTNLQTAFGSEAVGRLAYAVCFLVLALLAIASFSGAVAIAREAVTSLVTFMLALLPALSTLLAAMGAPVSAALIHPAMVAVITIVSQVISDLVFPLLLFSATLDLVGHVSDDFDLSGLTSLLRQVAVFVLGASLSVFLGVVVVRKAAGEVTDGMALRTAKFVSGTFIPVVGKMFSDAAELVFSSSLLLKNAVGAVGMIGILVVCAFPLLKIICLVFVYRLGQALIAPVGAGRLANCLGSIANSLLVLWASLASVALMFFLSITILMNVARPY